MSGSCSCSHSNVRGSLALLLPLLLLTFSCSPPADNSEVFELTGVPRLTKYYPVVDAHGDTTYKTIPSDTFINQHGQPFITADLAGNISVVQIFFTSCEGICPIISGSMSQVQKEFRGDKNVSLVSFSVDPARDSVPALRSYCERFRCDIGNWTLLTGDKKKIYDQIRYGYQLPDIEPGNGDEEDFIHSDQLVLVDGNSIVRGYYSGTDTAQVRMLIEDIHLLIIENERLSGTNPD